jgi:hypothetical protein
MKGSAFLRSVWSHQPSGYHFVIYRDGKTWLEKCVKPDQEFEILLPQRGDLYFCPNAFSTPIRQKQYVLPSRVMYQDLDEADPRDAPLPPDLWWETSLGRWQALWFLSGPAVEPLEFAALNRGLNRACGADPGTWNLTRVLRVPGSWNAKRSCRVSSAYSSDLLKVVA